MEVENKLYADMHGVRQTTQPPPNYTSTLQKQQQPPGQLHGFQPYALSTPTATASPYYMYAAPARPGYTATQQPQQQQVTMATSHSIY